ncbi:hypothetical protein BDV19DRAFT_360671, partial [Aspergillus venezuelensis]
MRGHCRDRRLRGGIWCLCCGLVVYGVGLYGNYGPESFVMFGRTEQLGYKGAGLIFAQNPI